MYLGIYLKKNNKKTGKKRKKKERSKKGKKGSNPAPSARCELYLTTTPLRLIMSSWRKVFNLMPFPQKIHWQMPLKMIEPRYWQLKKKQQQKQNAFHGNEWMKEHTFYALQSRYTSSAKYDAKYMFSYLDFRCYFEANGQNHIHFWLIQVLKNSMTWYFLTFRPLSSKLEFVYSVSPVILWSRVEEKMLIFSSLESPS